MNFLKIPFISPFKFVPATQMPGIHFDDSWACEQIKSWEVQARYRQKWQRGDETPIQIESTVVPSNLQVYDSNRQVVKSFVWQAVWSDVNFKIYETIVNLDDLPDGVYFLYQVATIPGMPTLWASITEPIALKNKWKNTVLLNYYNSFNDYDIAWSTGIKMNFRIEAAIGEFAAEAERTNNISQTNDIETLYAVPWRSFKFLVGDAAGVANWVVDLLNRIWLCNRVSIEGMRYERKEGAKIEVTRAKGYPLVGCSIDIQPAFNNQSLEFQDQAEIARGIITAYNIDTAFFGPGALIPITDIQKQG